MPTPTIIDLFSGCGGFGLGAELAGFHCKVAVDVDPDLQSAYRLNFPATQAVTCDISLMNAQSWRFLIGEQKIDGIIGGPPCQGFSRIGKNQKDDPRRELITHFFRTVNIVRPKFFLMENVEGLMDRKNLAGLNAAIKAVDDTYIVLQPFVVDAAAFGAATRRRRVLVFGYDPKYVWHVERDDFHHDLQRPVTVAEAISDLPNPITVVKGENEYGFAKYPRSKSLSVYARGMRVPPPAGLGSKLGATMQEKGFTSGLFDTVHSPEVANRFFLTPAGGIEPISRYPKLSLTGQCPTLRAGTGKDRGNFQAARPIHPLEPRVITVREAARLQGFPDWFMFHHAKWHSFRMIGNSVSPILATNILATIKSKLKKVRTQRKTEG